MANDKRAAGGNFVGSDDPGTTPGFGEDTAGKEFLGGKAEKGPADGKAITREIIGRFPKILAALAK